ncbi:hypothetical protein GCM10017567_05330 [Amycolatopsis bullii]|uniref:MBL fold metallo-hydrolase n=1 Tax=Amycolatopsis bullii TaxID=941987 RepID=A0ABQ3JYG0_9PSEU|nr:hypothetical protein GCM10017567_05330 [Amycolatopsis bullii]
MNFSVRLSGACKRVVLTDHTPLTGGYGTHNPELARVVRPGGPPDTTFDIRATVLSPGD